MTVLAYYWLINFGIGHIISLLRRLCTELPNWSYNLHSPDGSTEQLLVSVIFRRFPTSVAAVELTKSVHQL